MKLQNINNFSFHGNSGDKKSNSPLKRYAVDSHVSLTDYVFGDITGNKQKSLRALESFYSGEITRPEMEKELQQKYEARKESGEILSDLATSAAAFAVFAKIAQYGSVTELFKKGIKTKTNIIALGASILTGALIKPVLSSIDNLGAAKEHRNKHPFLENAAHGALNGLASPLLATTNIFLAVPALIGINTGARYLNESKPNKSFKDYWQIQRDNILFHLPEIFALGFMAVKGKGAIRSWESASQKAKENIKQQASFELPYSNKLNLEQLTQNLSKEQQYEMFLKVLPIFNDVNFNANSLVDMNIFIAKFLQTIPDKQIDAMKAIHSMDIPDELKAAIKALKGSCPPSYTPQEAQSVVAGAYGAKYTITRPEPLGVGTVAETYLARDNDSGKEVVIKFMKKGITKAKIEADRRQALELLEKSKIHDNKEEYTYYRTYLNTMYDAWVKETDLSLEKEAAEGMAVNARKFNVVKPICVKDNVYVMEKAKGVQLNKLDEELQRRGMTLTQEQVKKLILNYNQVFIEQLISIPRSGQKFIQADPNASNIFINLDDLDKPITFLDLGNVLRYDNLTATRNAIGHLDYIFGNSRGIAKTNLEGAILPEGMNMDDAIEAVAKALDSQIFNNKTKVPTPNAINDFCSHVMKEMKIVPNANNANLIKAETTYFSNIFELRNKIQSGLAQEIGKHTGLSDQLKTMLKEMKDTGDFQTLIRCIITEILTSVKNASFKTQRHALNEFRDRMRYIEENKEQALTTFYGLIS